MGYIVNEELEQILSSFEFEEYGFDRLDSFAGSEDSMELQFIVAILDGRKDKQRWRVTATDVLDAALHPNDSGLEFSVTHPTLRQYTEPAARLSIRGKPDDPLALILALSSPRRPNKYRDYSMDVLAAGYGIVAECPQSRVEEIARVLEEHGVETHMTLGQAPPPRKPIALLMSRGYVIAENMVVEKMP